LKPDSAHEVGLCHPTSNHKASRFRVLLAAKKIWREHKPLLLILAGSWILRIALILRGGPLSWPDDYRYFQANRLLGHLKRLDFGAALDSIIIYPDHTFFTVVALIPTVARLVVVKSLAAGASFLGLSFQTDIASTIWIAASVLSLASVVNIALVYGLARKTGSSEREALFAACLMAGATSTFYLTRHLVPYEAALAFALTAMWIGLDDRSSLTRSYVCGLMCSVAFFTYNAYWVTALVVMAIHVLRGRPWRWQLAKRAAGSGLGFATPLIGLLAADILRDTELYIVGAKRFSRSVVAGDYAEGWSLPWAHFWHAEHGILLVWAAGVAVALWQLLRKRRMPRGAGSLWLATLLAIYVALVLVSNVLHLFVMNARCTNQMVPFLCLTAACGLAQLQGTSQKVIFFALGAMCLQTVYNFAQPFRIFFPYEIRQRVRAEYGEFRDDMTLYCHFWIMDAEGIPAWLEDSRTETESRSAPPPRYVLLNGGVHLVPVTGPKDAPTKGEVLFKLRHMLSYLPYQYQAFTPKERAIIRSTDISMRLIDTTSDRHSSD
jgi:hypothetical protein